MFRIAKKWSLLLCLLPALSAGAQSQSGEVYYRLRFFDWDTCSYTASPLFPDMRLLFRDSVFIARPQSVQHRAENNTDLGFTYSVTHYTLVDLRSWNSYEFETFTDSALLLDCYRTKETDKRRLRDVPFGWEPGISLQALQPLSDTVADGRNYTRFKGRPTGHSGNGPDRREYIYFGDSSCRSCVLSFPNPVSSLPVLRIEVWRNGWPLYWAGYEYTGQKLNAEEERVLDAWLERVRYLAVE